MIHVLVLAPGDVVDLQWQRSNGRLPVTETRTGPSSRDEARDTVVQLSPWLAHHQTCARVTGRVDCDCGLNDLVRPLGWSI